MATSQLAGNAISLVVPGGAAFGAATQFRMLAASGNDAATAVGGLTAFSLLGIGGLLALPIFVLPAILAGTPIANGLQHAALLGIVAFVLFAGFGALVLGTDRPIRWAGRVVEAARNRTKRRSEPMTGLQDRLVYERNRIRDVLGRRWKEAMLLSSGRLAFDFGTLLATIRATGAKPNPSLVLLAYAVAGLLALIPITPGGLGIVEAGLERAADPGGSAGRRRHRGDAGLPHHLVLAADSRGAVRVSRLPPALRAAGRRRGAGPPARGRGRRSPRASRMSCALHGLGTLHAGRCSGGAETCEDATAMYEGTWESVRTHRVPVWYDDAKLGIFIHWGLYSVPGWAPRVPDIQQLLIADGPTRMLRENPYAEWYRNTMQIMGSPTQLHHAEVYGDDYPYDNFVKTFNDASAGANLDAIADLCQAAGARYVVLTTKHHDGFALWPSAIVHPAKGEYHTRRDLVGDLSVAVRSRRMRMGLYYSGGYDWPYNDAVLSKRGGRRARRPARPAVRRVRDRSLARADRPLPAVRLVERHLVAGWREPRRSLRLLLQQRGRGRHQRPLARVEPSAATSSPTRSSAERAPSCSGCGGSSPNDGSA